MTLDQFRFQVQRLTTRFTTRAFDQEFTNLVWREVKEMSEAGFARFCDVLIGSRTANKPPLLSDFREARLAEEKLRFQNDLKGAANLLKREAPEEMRAHLRQILSKEFGGVSGVVESLEIAKFRMRIEP